MKYFIAYLLLLSSISALAQYPRFLFRNPLGIPMQLIANFGEVRTDHYHLGLDLRTQQRENLPVYAAAEGYVSRITIEEGGYGKCIYITHPNNYTTVYAHLNKFFSSLQQFVEHKQYHDEKWEQDIYFPAPQFPVSKGQFIAFSGSTGATEGPHLHFEIRDTKTGNNINPLFFGFPIKDQLKPFIYSLYLYDRNYSTYTVDPVQIKIKGGKGKYITRDAIVQTASNKISFGISAEDIANGSSFRFGIYAAELWIDSVMQFSFKLRELNYEDSRYTNAAIDYKKRFNEKALIQHLSRLPGNHLSIYEGINNGLIELKDTLPHNISIIVSDVAGNESKLNFTLVWKPELYEPKLFTQETVKFAPNKTNEFNLDNITVNLPSTALYDTINFYHSEITTGYNGLPIHQVHYSYVPLNDAYSISIKAEGEQNDSKVVMRIATGTSTQIVKPHYVDKRYNAELNKFGIIVLIEDTIPPNISTTWKDGAAFAKNGSLSFTAKDALSSIKNVRAEVDGRWLLFERNGNVFTYKFDEYCSIGKHKLKILATDVAGNEINRTYTFELKEKLPVKKKAVKKSSKKKNGNTSKRRR